MQNLHFWGNSSRPKTQLEFRPLCITFDFLCAWLQLILFLRGFELKFAKFTKLGCLQKHIDADATHEAAAGQKRTRNSDHCAYVQLILFLRGLKNWNLLHMLNFTQCGCSSRPKTHPKFRPLCLACDCLSTMNSLFTRIWIEICKLRSKTRSTKAHRCGRHLRGSSSRPKTHPKFRPLCI